MKMQLKEIIERGESYYRLSVDDAYQNFSLDADDLSIASLLVRLANRVFPTIPRVLQGTPTPSQRATKDADEQWLDKKSRRCIYCKEYQLLSSVGSRDGTIGILAEGHGAKCPRGKFNDQLHRCESEFILKGRISI